MQIVGGEIGDESKDSEANLVILHIFIMAPAG
jgi:hypothetical protein